MDGVVDGGRDQRRVLELARGRARTRATVRPPMRCRASSSGLQARRGPRGRPRRGSARRPSATPTRSISRCRASCARRERLASAGPGRSGPRRRARASARRTGRAPTARARPTGRRRTAARRGSSGVSRCRLRSGSVDDDLAAACRPRSGRRTFAICRLLPLPCALRPPRSCRPCRPRARRSGRASRSRPACRSAPRTRPRPRPSGPSSPPANAARRQRRPP